jgi:hypothetical protein
LQIVLAGAGEIEEQGESSIEEIAPVPTYSENQPPRAIALNSKWGGSYPERVVVSISQL